MSDTVTCGDAVAVRELVADLPGTVARYRRVLGLSMREVCAQSGVGLNALCRFENGHVVRAATSERLLVWVKAQSPAFVRALDADRAVVPAGWADPCSSSGCELPPGHSGWHRAHIPGSRGGALEWTTP